MVQVLGGSSSAAAAPRSPSVKAEQDTEPVASPAAAEEASGTPLLFTQPPLCTTSVLCSSPAERRLVPCSLMLCTVLQKPAWELGAVLGLGRVPGLRSLLCGVLSA